MTYFYLSLGSMPVRMANMVHYLSLGSVPIESGVLAVPEDTDPEVSTEIETTAAMSAGNDGSMGKTGTISASADMAAP